VKLQIKILERKNILHKNLNYSRISSILFEQLQQQAGEAVQSSHLEIFCLNGGEL